MDQNLSVQQLIEAGVHFGCRASRWNPKMAPFIHGRRNAIHVIDLRETMRGIIRAQNLLFQIASEGQGVLWVGTKRQVKGVVSEAGERTGMPIVTERWIGGTLTNFSVIRSRLRRLEQLEAIDEKKIEEQKLTKKEAGAGSHTNHCQPPIQITASLPHTSLPASHTHHCQRQGALP